MRFRRPRRPRAGAAVRPGAPCAGGSSCSRPCSPWQHGVRFRRHPGRAARTVPPRRLADRLRRRLRRPRRPHRPAHPLHLRVRQGVRLPGRRGVASGWPRALLAYQWWLARSAAGAGSSPSCSWSPARCAWPASTSRPTTTDKRFFMGLPIPAGAGALTVLVLVHPEPRHEPAASPLRLGVRPGVSLLMVSTVPYRTVQDREPAPAEALHHGLCHGARPRPAGRRVPEEAMAALLGFYLLAGPLESGWRRLSGHPINRLGTARLGRYPVPVTPTSMLTVLDPVSRRGAWIGLCEALARGSPARRYFHTTGDAEHLITEVAGEAQLVQPLHDPEELDGRHDRLSRRLPPPHRPAPEDVAGHRAGHQHHRLVAAPGARRRARPPSSPGPGGRRERGSSRPSRPALTGPVRVLAALAPLGVSAAHLTLVTPAADAGTDAQEELAAQAVARLSGHQPARPRHLPTSWRSTPARCRPSRRDHLAAQLASSGSGSRPTSRPLGSPRSTATGDRASSASRDRRAPRGGEPP